MLRSSLLIVFLTLSAVAGAEEFDYNWLGFSFGTIDYDPNLDGDKLGIDGSFAFHEDFHAFGSYEVADLDFGIDSTSFDIGVGYNTELSSVVDAWARLSFEYLEFEGPGGGSNDESGLGFGVGLRFAATPQIELNGAIEYVDLDDLADDTALILGGLYSFTPQFALGFFGKWSDDVSAYTLNGRFYWGQ